MGWEERCGGKRKVLCLDELRSWSDRDGTCTERRFPASPDPAPLSSPEPASGKIQVIMKGCVTPNVCTNLQTGSRTSQGTTIDITKVACTSGGAPGLSGLLPALAGLLMLKLLS